LDGRIQGLAGGAYWWDAAPRARALFLYFGHGSRTFEDRAGRPGPALLAIIGVGPADHLLLRSGGHLRARASFKGTSMHIAMLTGMVLMAFACWMYAIGTALVRVRTLILERERRARWVRELKVA
jgi:heme exporter protein C